MISFVRTKTLNDLRMQVHELSTESEMHALSAATLKDSLEFCQESYTQLHLHAEAALGFVEKLWNLTSIGKINEVLDVVLDDALPLLKEHSGKYTEVNVDEAQANVRTSLQARKP